MAYLTASERTDVSMECLKSRKRPLDAAARRQRFYIVTSKGQHNIRTSNTRSELRIYGVVPCKLWILVTSFVTCGPSTLAKSRPSVQFRTLLNTYLYTYTELNGELQSLSRIRKVALFGMRAAVTG